MKYLSTRSLEIPKNLTSFEETLFSGYAPDGGLYVPESIPKIDLATLEEWRGLTYQDIVANVLSLYLTEDEIPKEDLLKAIQKAYYTFKRRNKVITTRKIKVKSTDNDLEVAELFNGQTASFKDLALSLIGNLMQFFMKKRRGHVTVLVGTSGDTGSAAIHSIKGLIHLDIIVLYPKGMVSKVQEFQMQCALNENVHLYEVEGTSDDLDVPIAKCFPDSRITSINSISWARIMIQISHYIFLYLQKSSETVNFIVPTGAAGNITSGVICKLMGVPITLHAATNENDSVHKLIYDGVLEMGKNPIQTPANAMDICNPYNVERLIYFCSNPSYTKNIMTTPGRIEISTEVHQNLKSLISGSVSVSNAQIYCKISGTWELNNYLICPHTATGVYYFEKYQECFEPLSQSYVLATASPFKFLEELIKSGIKEESLSKLYNPFSDINYAEIKIPLTMKKEEDWYQILQDKITEINAKYMTN